MTWRETLRAALRGLRRRPLRNGLALAGVALATATLVALLALSNAARHNVLTGLEDILRAVKEGAEVRIGRWFTPEDIRTAETATTRLAIPGTAENPIAAYIDLPVSDLPTSGAIIRNAGGKGIEVVLSGRPIVPAMSIVIHLLP